MSTIILTDSDFEQKVIQSPLPVIVDFWAEWCTPCKAVSPILEELSGEYSGKITFAKMNVDDFPQTPSKYQVLSIPNFKIFKNGAVVDEIIGAVPKAHIKKVLDSIA